MPHIYKITNTINGKVYIGQTINSIEERFKHHKAQINCKNRCSALYSAFIKHGVENFIIESLICGDFTKSELNKLEIKYIQEHNSMSPSGYNLQTGGNSFLVSEEVKKKTSSKLMGRKITWSDKVGASIKKLWQDPDYRTRQTQQRFQKRGNYRRGIVRLALRKSINMDEFTKDYMEGMTIDNIAIKYSISVPTIYKIIKRENIEKRGHV